ncbi:MAG: VOC family protein [Actinomycetota bacterium]
MIVAFTSAFPIIYTEDIARALAFYRDLLGFVEDFRFPDDGEPVFVYLKLADGALALAEVNAATVPIHGKQLRPATGQQFEMCVYTDDIDAAVEKLRATGVPVLAEAVDQPWGEGLAYVGDPDDNPVMITAPA